MHTFTLTLSSDDDAFTLYPEYEVATILLQVSAAVQRNETEGVCKDSNGNRVGSWTATFAPILEPVA